MNFNYAIFNMSKHAGIAAPVQNIVIDLGQYEESMSGWGYGATFGILVKPNKIFSLGAAFRTANRIKFNGEANISNLSTLTSTFSRLDLAATLKTFRSMSVLNI